MKKLLLTLFIIYGSSFIAINAQIITTVAGNGIQGYTGDGGQATEAELYYPNAVGFDGLGNMYIADEGNSVIRKVTPTGVISTIAGNGAAGYGGDGGPATMAEIYAPEGVWGDAVGNVYIADLVNRRVRLVNTSGVITTFAGNGMFGYTGDGGPATLAEIGSTYRVALDNARNVYMVDQANDVIRKVDTMGIITTIAGNGTSGFYGDGGPATMAEIANPYGLTVDGAGTIYIADGGNNRVRMVSTTGTITTIAGNGIGGFAGDGSVATSAELSGPFGVAVDASGDIFIDDQGNERIRLVTASGIISTYAGNGVPGYSGDGGPATNAELLGVWDVSTDINGNVYISDEENQRVRFVPGVSTSVEKINAANSVNVYPNPNNGIFTLEWTVCSEQYTVEIYNTLGKKIYSYHSLPTTHYSLNVSSQPSGIYFYRVVHNDGSVLGSGKFIKQ